MRGISGEIVNRGIVDIDLHIRLVLGGKENGKSGDGKSGYDCITFLNFDE